MIIVHPVTDGACASCDTLQPTGVTRVGAEKAGSHFSFDLCPTCRATLRDLLAEQPAAGGVYGPLCSLTDSMRACPGACPVCSSPWREHTDRQLLRCADAEGRPGASEPAAAGERRPSDLWEDDGNDLGGWEMRVGPLWLVVEPSGDGWRWSIVEDDDGNEGIRLNPRS